LLAYGACAKGLNKLDDTEAIQAEPIQTVMRFTASPISTGNKAFNARRKILLEDATI